MAIFLIFDDGVQKLRGPHPGYNHVVSASSPGRSWCLLGSDPLPSGHCLACMLWEVGQGTGAGKSVGGLNGRSPKNESFISRCVRCTESNGDSEGPKCMR